ncbi:cation:proton antiporter [Rariglobus hedericola]|uniref:cation:proton antiporter n=1 Tax=Rariglobus hedericola TaxID=2597822 RepID=UPI00193A47E2|nr:sodium:proton antiporter [Rariglobus hedericola]
MLRLPDGTISPAGGRGDVTFESWMILISGLLLLMGLSTAYVSRWPFTGTMVYLCIGVLLGPVGWGILQLDPHRQVSLFLHASEVTVVISLFTVGLKLRLPLRDPRWGPAVMLAFGSMTVTVGLITVTGMWALNLPLGAAVLLGAILAPTDPVLASDLQLKHAGDRSELRSALTGEAGFNDGTAFPFVMLGLGLLGLHDLGAGGWRWWAVDVIWAVGGGLGIGVAMGYGTGRLIVHLRKREREGATLDEYLLLGLIGVSYAVAVKLHAYGFLSVFAAGVAVRAIERQGPGTRRKGTGKETRQTEPSKVESANPAAAMLSFNEQLERILEVGMVVLVGAALLVVGLSTHALWFVPLLFCVVRPLAVWPLVWLRKFHRKQLTGIMWFGIRGIGSIYYLMYAIDKGLPPDLARPLAALTFTVVAASIVLHGISVTPLLNRLQRRPRT